MSLHREDAERLLLQGHRMALEQDERLERIEAALLLPGRVERVRANRRAVRAAALSAIRRVRHQEGAGSIGMDAP